LRTHGFCNIRSLSTPPTHTHTRARARARQKRCTVCAQPRPGETRLVEWTDSPLRLRFCAAAFKLSCTDAGLCALVRAPLTGEGPLAALLTACLLVFALAVGWALHRWLTPSSGERAARRRGGEARHVPLRTSEQPPHEPSDELSHIMRHADDD